VGRRAELDALGQSVDGIEQGSPRLVAIEGEAGIGKTRLLVELAELARGRGHRVLVGRAGELEGDLPFGPFVDALDSHLASRRAGLPPAPWVPELAAVFPALAGPDDRPVLPAERYRTYRAARALLAELAADGPLVVTLDDMHWADPGSVELLCHLWAHAVDGPVLLAAAYRPAQAAPRLASALAGAVRDHRAELLGLRPLTRWEADELVGPGPRQASRESLYRDSGGNPFYLEQLARAAPLTDGLPSGHGTEADPPPPVRAALDSELAELSAQARTLLQGAAVAGDPFAVESAAVAAGIDPRHAATLVDELVKRDLVRPGDAPRRFCFRHPIVRRAVYTASGPAWRVAAHARIAELLLEQGLAATAVAHHVELSAATGDARAVALLAEAAAAISSQAPSTAARWYRSAIRLLPPGDDHAEQCMELLIASAVALASAGELEEGREALLDALGRLAPGGPIWLGLVGMCAGVEVVLGRVEEGRDRLVRALKELGDDESPEAVELKLRLAAAATFTGDYLTVQALADGILRSDGSLGRPAVVATATSLLALAEYSLGRTSAADVRLREAAALFDGLDDASLTPHTDAAMWLAIAEIGMERFGDAVTHCQRGIAVSRATGRGQWLVAIMHCRVLALTFQGRLGEAVELAAEAVEAGRVAGHAQALVTVLFEQCWAATQAGDLATAIRAGEEAVEAARGFDRGINTSMPGLALAAALLAAGQPQRARGELLEAAGGPDLPFLQRGLRWLAFEVLAAVELALGQPEAAEPWVAALERIAADEALPRELSAAARVRAAALLATGQPGPAAELALVAAQRARAAPVEAARSRTLAGVALARVGQRDRAMAELARAEAELSACGAQGYREEAAAALARLGRRRARRPAGASSGLAALSEREAQIAALVSEGLTNRRIAARCFLSEKTVERHLTNVYVKLGISGRAALSALVARHAEVRSPG
jgi:DNA-binding CsgD family transcriptional regulator